MESHPFSLTSSPTDDAASFSIKNLGDFTSHIVTLTPGVMVDIEGPFGTFSYLRADLKTQIWIAGGIGITPFLSMAKSLSQTTDYRVQ